MELMETQNINDNSMDELLGSPFKILDYSGQKRIGVVARNLNDLIERARVKLEIPPDTPIRVALEQDGTEVEDDDYFFTLEKNTALMILVGDQKWLPFTKYSKYRYAFDETDGDEGKPPAAHLEKLVDQLYSDLTCITLLGGKDLELLADMDPESIADFFPADNRYFFDSLKEASVRFLTEKEQAKEAMELLRLYHERHVAAQRNENKEEE